MRRRRARSSGSALCGAPIPSPRRCRSSSAAPMRAAQRDQGGRSDHVGGDHGPPRACSCPGCTSQPATRTRRAPPPHAAPPRRPHPSSSSSAAVALSWSSAVAGADRRACTASASGRATTEGCGSASRRGRLPSGSVPRPVVTRGDGRCSGPDNGHLGGQRLPRLIAPLSAPRRAMARSGAGAGRAPL